MKTHSVEVDTRKTLQQIIQILNSFKCNIQRINPDPFGTDQADIEVVMVGKATYADTIKNVGAGKSEWGVQVYVYDMGKYRHCVLVALGESSFASGMGRSMTDIAINGLDYINMRHSKTYRDKIIRKLEPIDTAAEKRKADANRSSLYKALRSLSDIDEDELFKREWSAMTPIIERFLKNHPDFSAAQALRSGGQSAIDEMNAATAELMQMAEDDMLSGNDRSALYVLAFYASMLDVQGNMAAFFINSLLDRVLRLENSGKNVTEDLKIWPLLAKSMDFDDWHQSKYGENGTSGRFDPSDPALSSRTAVPAAEPEPAVVPAEPAPKPKPVPAATAKHAKHATSTPAITASAGKAAKKPVISGSGDSVTISKRTLIIGAAVIAAIILLLAGKALFGGHGGGSEAVLPAQEDNTAETSAPEAISDGIVVLSSDWDWDSSRETGDYYVDAIMFVRNDTDRAITGIDFEAYSKDGELIYNAEDPGVPFRAFGYVESGSSGIMTGEICTDEKAVKPDDGLYTITGIYTNESIKDYIVPQGYVVRNYGEDNNYYDVSIDNRNDADVSADAILVMIKIENNKIKDSDATGRLTDSIDGNTFGYVQEAAFYDPHMYTKYEELSVFAIDKSYLQNAH